MYLISELVPPVEAAPSLRVAATDMEAVIGEAFAGLKFGLFPNDLVALDYERFAFLAFDYPFPAEKLDCPFGAIFHCDKVNENMWRFGRYVGSSVLITKVV